MAFFAPGNCTSPRKGVGPVTRRISIENPSERELRIQVISFLSNQNACLGVGRHGLFLVWAFIGIQFPGCPDVVVGTTTKTQGGEANFKCAHVGCTASETIIEVGNRYAAVDDRVGHRDDGICNVAFDIALFDSNAAPLNFGGDRGRIVFEVV